MLIHTPGFLVTSKTGSFLGKRCGDVLLLCLNGTKHNGMAACVRMNSHVGWVQVSGEVWMQGVEQGEVCLSSLRTCLTMESHNGGLRVIFGATVEIRCLFCLLLQEL